MTCAPLSRDPFNPHEIGLNDALGNYSLTLIDSLSTLAVLAGGPEDEPRTGSAALTDFQDGVAQFVDHYGDGRPGLTGTGTRARGFDLDSKIQVFETVIRGVGGLLSAHLFAVGELPIVGYEPKAFLQRDSKDGDTSGAGDENPLELPAIPWLNGFEYDGQLLRLALDLAERLLPAFYTQTGIPYPRVNLRHGIPFYVNSPLHQFSDEERAEAANREITETCSAGAGSLTLEFTVLSRLSGDARFEQAAKRAFWEVWGRRSELGLIGNGIDAERGYWVGPHSGIGAGMDSFFEYAFKSHILLSGAEMPNASIVQRGSNTVRIDPNSLFTPLPPELQTSDAFLQTWHQAHASVKRYIYTDRNHYPYYSNNHRATGQPYTMWIDSLGAFYPGLLALAGEVEEAIEANLVYTALWTRYAALPERWSFRENNIDSGIGWWPGRPEFIESTYYIYRATKDPWYLYVGEMVLKDIRWRCYAPCGWAGLQDVRTGEKQDRMESFFLGETTKYMYLLFDPDHALNKLDAPFVFSTEGHPLIIPRKKRKKKPQGTPSTTQKVPRQKGPQLPAPLYDDESPTYSCPAPPTLRSLTGSATATRPDLFSVSRFTDLYNTPNLRGPLEAVEVLDEKRGIVTKYRPLSNHTVFPWTLPPNLLGDNGTCTAPRERSVTWIEFPSSDAFSSVVSRFGTSLVWNSHLGPTVKNLEGLRVRLERAMDDMTGEDSWIITQVGGTQLSGHETVQFYAEHVAHLKDDVFTAVRRSDAVDIDTYIDGSKRKGMSPGDGLDAVAGNTSNTSNTHHHHSNHGHRAKPAPSSDSLLKSLIRSLHSVFEPAQTTTAPKTMRVKYRDEVAGEDWLDDDDDIFSWYAATAHGPGAFPVPPVSSTSAPESPTFNTANPLANFPWRTVYPAGYACDGPLPDSAPRDHQVIVMRRGGCAFSTKLANVPPYSPAKKSLQLVVVVDEHVPDEHIAEDDTSPIRPYLNIEQLTPKGMKRLHGIPMVLVDAADGDYDTIASAVGFGMRRKYVLQSQGLIIRNAVVV